MSSKLQDLRSARLAARSVLERMGGLAFKPESSAKWTDVHRSWTGVITVKIEHGDPPADGPKEWVTDFIVYVK